MIPILVLVNIIARVVPHIPNFAAVSATGLFLGTTQDRLWKAIVVTLLCMVVTDYALLYISPYSTGSFSTVYSPDAIIYGYTQIAVYLSIGISCIIGRGIQRYQTITGIPIAAILCSLQFFLITNAAVWLFGAYDRGISGLYQSYVMGLPFLKGTLLGDLTYTCLFFGAYYAISNRKDVAVQTVQDRISSTK